VCATVMTVAIISAMTSGALNNGIIWGAPCVRFSCSL
jgi:hypothetical protein